MVAEVRRRDPRDGADEEVDTALVPGDPYAASRNEGSQEGIHHRRGPGSADAREREVPGRDRLVRSGPHKIVGRVILGLRGLGGDDVDAAGDLDRRVGAEIGGRKHGVAKAVQRHP